MNIKDLVTNTGKLAYRELGTALIEKFGVRQPVNWDSVLPYDMQKSLFGSETLRLIADHPSFENQHDIRAICRMPGDLSQLLFFYVQLKDEKLPKPVIERITRKFVGGASADRYIIWFFGNRNADVLKVVISGREGKKIRLKTLPLEAGQWFKTYDYILDEVERKFNTGGLFQTIKEPSGLYKAIWEAFDISIVNKKFYAEIKEVFDKLIRQELPKCKGVLTDEQERVQFAIRLIGRIIFCWFLKRKGIIKDDVMSSAAVRSNKNYYRDLLQLLFFEVFNTPVKERRKDLPVSIKEYPFLNGGLFEPQKQDCKDNYALYIPDEWFEGFFGNTLEKYNFTIDENTAASAEIAIDPEMLGRIFENLLAEINPETGESARKSTGSFYTPREIVDFMVEESLIAYLKAGLSDNSPLSRGVRGVSPTLAKGGEGGFEEALEDFVRTAVLSDVLKPYSKELLALLNAIKVLDPASGSGAFPISMLQKIVELKHVLDPQASLYDLKLKTLENSIYGVDIQPMATELSRLRCWLSLMVDEDPKDIKPLPNLDFKFVTANSLIDLGYDEFIHKVETGKAKGLFLHEFKNKLNELRSVRQKYFDPAMGQREKDRLKKEFNSVKAELYNMSLELIKQKVLDAEFANKINKWNPFDDSEAAPFFSSEWMFGVEEGFDVVIANPPYVSAPSMVSSYRELRQMIIDSKKYKSLYQKWDLYIPFMELGLQLLTSNGVFCMIVPYPLTNQNYGLKLRELIINDYCLKEIVDLNSTKVFENATVSNCIPFITKSKPQNSCYVSNINQYGKIERVFIQNINDLVQDKNTLVWNLTPEKRESTRHYIFNVLGDYCYISKGMVLNADENTAKGEFSKDDLISETYDDTHCRKYIEAKDIERYRVKKERYLEYNTKRCPGNLSRPTFRELYERPKLMFNRLGNLMVIFDAEVKYLHSDSMYSAVLWNDLDGVENKSISASIKRYSNLSRKEMVKLSRGVDLRYILGVLNSKYGSVLLTNLRAGDYHIYPEHIRNIPIPNVPANQQKPFIILVDKIIAAKKKEPNADTSALEAEINKLVYALYGLTPEEIAIVEGKG